MIGVVSVTVSDICMQRSLTESHLYAIGIKSQQSHLGLLELLTYFLSVITFLAVNSEKSFVMPGHIKLVKGAVDPDPTEFLLPSMDMKKEDQNKPYDAKKSVWIADPKTSGYRQGLLEDGDIASLGAEGADLTVKMVVAVG